MHKLHSLHFLGIIAVFLLAWHFSWFGLSDDFYGGILIALMFAVMIHVYYLVRNGELAMEEICR